MNILVRAQFGHVDSFGPLNLGSYVLEEEDIVARGEHLNKIRLFNNLISKISFMKT